MTAIPAELQELAQWVGWRYGPADKNGKVPKIPISAKTGRAINAQDPSKHADFEAAKAAVARYRLNGVGFVIRKENPYTFIDMDDCIGLNGMTPEAAALIERFNTHAEITPSASGVRIMIRAKKPEGAACVKSTVYGCSKLEVYDDQRYITVTGEHIASTPAAIENRQEELNAFCAELWPNTKANTGCKSVTPSANISQGGGGGYENNNRNFASVACWNYVSQIADAVSGNCGGYTTFRAACEMWKFDLSEDEAWVLMIRFNATKCKPPWDERELRRKLADARKRVEADGEIGCRNRGFKREGAKRVRGGYHVRLPKWIRAIKFKPYQNAVLQAVADQCDKEPFDEHGSLGVARVGYEALAHESSVSLRTVQRHVSRFVSVGLIVVTECGSIDFKTGVVTANQYCIPGEEGVLKTCDEWFRRQKINKNRGLKWRGIKRGGKRSDGMTESHHTNTNQYRVTGCHPVPALLKAVGDD